MDIINPATEEVIDNVQEDDVRSVEKKYEKLQGGLDSWRNTPLSDRIALIDKFKECIKEEMSELADVLSQETGKPLAQAIGELKGTCNRIKFFPFFCTIIISAMKFHWHWGCFID